MNRITKRVSFLAPVIDPREAERIEIKLQQRICLVKDGGDAFDDKLHVVILYKASR